MTGPLMRHSVRALILTPDRDLLLGSHGTPDGFVWAAPGGGIEPGETPIEALTRELEEEIGLDLSLLEPPLVWRQEIVDNSICHGYEGVVNDYFLVEIDRFEPQGFWSREALLNEGLHEFFWWSWEAIQNSGPTHLFSPRNLAELFPSIGHGDNLLKPLLLSV